MGCLVTAAIIIAAAIVGVRFGKVYWRFYQFQDDMRQEIKFAAHSSNEQILVHMRADADSLGMPDDATKINIRRNTGGISIESEYTEVVALPGYVREIRFHPHAEGPI